MKTLSQTSSTSTLLLILSHFSLLNLDIFDFYLYSHFCCIYVRRQFWQSCCRLMELPIFYFSLQPSCLLSTSKVQSGVSQCVWNQSLLSCSLRPPPTGPIFTILVSLLTTIITVPILLLVRYVLLGYASHKPIKRGSIDETEIGEESSKKNKLNRQSAANLTTAEKLRNSICSSPFGKEMKRASPASDLTDSVTAGTISQIAYTGMYTKSNLRIISAPITAFTCILNAVNTISLTLIHPSILHFLSQVQNWSCFTFDHREN